MVLTSMTLNGLKWRNSPFLHFSPNSIALQANYVTVIEDRPIDQSLYSSFGQN